MPARREPPPPRPRLRRTAWITLAGAAAIVAVTIAAARRAPDWYVASLAPRDAAARERDARRLVTTVAGLRAAATQPGEWGAALGEGEINAWLATLLPREHAAMLPAGFSAPRVRLEAGQVRVAARAGAGPFVGLVSFVLEVRLRSADRLECAVAEARVGAIPVPPGPLIHRVAALLGRAGLSTAIRRLDGRSVVVVSCGGRGVVLRGLSVDPGELVVAGTTEERR